MKTINEIVADLKAMVNSVHRQGMGKFGINTNSALGIKMPLLRNYAKEMGKKDHVLAQELWETGIHEARILASLVDDPKKVTEKQMDNWVAKFDSWDLCDQVVGNLFDKTPFAWDKAIEWVDDEREFVRRAGFAMMAYLAVHDKKASDTEFVQFLPLIEQYAFDSRNFVQKAVNWALRQIGKRNETLHQYAVAAAERIMEQKSSAAKWIAADALRELQSEKVRLSFQRST